MKVKGRYLAVAACAVVLTGGAAAIAQVGGDSSSPYPAAASADGQSPDSARAPGSEVEKLQLQGVRGTYRLGEFRTKSGQLRTEIIHPDGTHGVGGGCAIGSDVLRLCNVQALEAGGPVLLSGSASASVAEVAAEDANGQQVAGRVANGRFLIMTQGDFRPVRVVGLDAGGGVLSRTDGDGVIKATFEVLK